MEKFGARVYLNVAKVRTRVRVLFEFVARQIVHALSHITVTSSQLPLHVIENARTHSIRIGHIQNRHVCLPSFSRAVFAGAVATSLNCFAETEYTANSSLRSQLEITYYGLDEHSFGETVESAAIQWPVPTDEYIEDLKRRPSFEHHPSFPDNLSGRRNEECGDAVRKYIEELDRESETSYLRNCFKHFSELPDFLPSFADVAGILWKKDYPTCSGFRYGGDYIVTARHCLDFRDNGSPRSIGDMSFSFLNARDKRYNLDPTYIRTDIVYKNRTEKSQSMERYDYVILKTSSPIQRSEVDVVIRPPKSWEPLVLFSEERYWDNASTCVIANVLDGCIYHGCQSNAKYSGSPLFARNPEVQGRVEVVGLHTATAPFPTTSTKIHQDNRCPTPDYLAKGNKGITLNDKNLVIELKGGE